MWKTISFCLVATLADQDHQFPARVSGRKRMEKVNKIMRTKQKLHPDFSLPVSLSDKPSAHRMPGKTVAAGGEACSPSRSQRASLKAIVRDVLHQRIEDQRKTDPGAAAELQQKVNASESFVRPASSPRNGVTHRSAAYQQQATELKNNDPRREDMNNSDLNAGAANALAQLDKARKYADSCGSNPWEFALEISELNEQGIDRNLLRYLVLQGLIEHRAEVTASGEGTRSFQEKDLAFSSRSCFVLTDKGRQAVYSKLSLSLGHNVNMNPNGGPPEDRNDRERRMQPFWDEKLRELKLGEQVIKRFKWPAANQERVIRAFQEEGWPVKIDDPLPPSNDVCPKRRLHDTIKCLNRKQVCKAIRFRGDGTGQGVMIEIIPEKIDEQAR